MTHRETYIAYLKMKVEEQDWHGVSDAANDLRELDAALPAAKAEKSPVLSSSTNTRDWLEYQKVRDLYFGSLKP